MLPFLPALLGAGASLVGGVLSSRASKKAAQAQADSADRASQVQKQMYDQTRQDLDPYRKAGDGALGLMMGKMSPDGYFNQTYKGQDVYNDPSYQFRLNQGLQAIEQGSASQGNLLSGAKNSSLKSN